LGTVRKRGKTNVGVSGGGAKKAGKGGGGKNPFTRQGGGTRAKKADYKEEKEEKRTEKSPRKVEGGGWQRPEWLPPNWKS